MIEYYCVESHQVEVDVPSMLTYSTRTTSSRHYSIVWYEWRFVQGTSESDHAGPVSLAPALYRLLATVFRLPALPVFASLIVESVESLSISNRL
jgi:hypothetical protein